MFSLLVLVILSLYLLIM